MRLRDDLAAALRIGAYASGSWEERVDALLPVIDAALTDEALVEAVALGVAELGPGEPWPSNADLGGGPTGTRDDEFRDAHLHVAMVALTAVREYLGSQR